MIILSAIVGILANCICFILSLSSGSFPKPLSAKEELEYLEKFADGDENARNILIERNLRLVAHIIKKYYTSPQEQEDLISIGTIGLIKAINTYKPNKGTRLATYAARCIENEILMYFRATKKNGAEVSLSDSLDTDSDGNSLALMDVISTEDIRLERIESLDTEENLYRLVNKCLEPREREIIILRYGLYDCIPKTQHEIAQKCNISRSYVSRIEKRALEKLRASFGDIKK
ncbi:MAG: RNA polymerase sporulation sigma factor SigK [Oscillospiraceae bacterium]|nr:RNA polymerase sporulation sigma factor SigK [Oscillospiraceae bacterium]